MPQDFMIGDWPVRSIAQEELRDAAVIIVHAEDTESREAIEQLVTLCDAFNAQWDRLGAPRGCVFVVGLEDAVDLAPPDDPWAVLLGNVARRDPETSDLTPATIARVLTVMRRWATASRSKGVN